MVTRKLLRLIDHVEAAGAKVLLVGDPCQLPEIDAGRVVGIGVAEVGERVRDCPRPALAGRSCVRW
jgi:ATP-dependent exoDNAse (exonuclease V) alpha subunit